MNLHNYQDGHVEEILQKFKEFKSIMLQMPTGTGKTHVFCEIAKHFCHSGETKNSRVLILAHRTELILQIKERLISFGFQAGNIQAGEKFKEQSQIQIASVQTLTKKNGKNKIALLENISLIIIDEAHHTTSKTYREILDVYKNENTKILGVSATPTRLDGIGFKDIFDYLITSHSFKWFVNNRFLCPIKHYASDIIKLDGHISTNQNKEGYQDYNINQAEKYYLNMTIMSDIIDSYIKYGENKKCVVFAVSIKHANEIGKRFIQAGFSVRVITSETSSATRLSHIADFKLGHIKILINVDIFTEGFDCPDIEVVQIAKPTQSLVKYLQMVGRVARVCEGKPYGIILDNSCLWQDHGLASSDREWTLDGFITKAEKEDYDSLIMNGKRINENKIKDIKFIQMIEVDDVKVETELVFTRIRFIALCIKQGITVDQGFRYLDSINFPIKEHLKGNGKPNERFVTVELGNKIKDKFSSNKSLHDIEI